MITTWKTTWRFDKSRRRFIQKAGAAAASAAIGPLLITERTIAQTRTLYVNTWGGSYTAAQDAAFYKPFTEATGIQIKTVTPVSYGKHQGAGADRQLRIRHDLDQLHAVAARQPRRSCRADRLEHRQEGRAAARRHRRRRLWHRAEHPRHSAVLPHRQIPERRHRNRGPISGT